MIGVLLDVCVSSLRRGHANLLCIVPILNFVRRQTAEGETTILGSCFARIVQGEKADSCAFANIQHLHFFVVVTVYKRTVTLAYLHAIVLLKE